MARHSSATVPTGPGQRNRKSRTGCLTCRIRRVKCDERKPYCDRCTSTGRRCEGPTPHTYRFVDDTSAKLKERSLATALGTTDSRPTISPGDVSKILSSGSSAASLQIRVRCAAPQSPPSIKSFSCEAERCGFDSFRQILEVAYGYGLGWPEWGSVVMQNSESDPALRHAIVALGAMHEDALRNFGTVTTTYSGHLLPLAYKQYHQAITTLRSQLRHGSTNSIEANMLVCILLVMFDFLRGDDRAAAAHLFGGIAILRNYLAQRKRSEALIDRISTPWRKSLERSNVFPTEGSFGARLLLSYGYLDFWSSYYMDNPPALPEVSVLEGLQVIRPPQPETELNTSFQNFFPLENRIREFLRAARGSKRLRQSNQDILIQPRSFHSKKSRNAPPLCEDPTSNQASVTFVDMKKALINDLSQWLENYQRVCSAHTCTETWEIQAINVVGVNHKKIETMLLAAQEDGTVNYQASTPAFGEVLTLSRKVVEDETFPAASPYYENLPFSFTIGIIHPLFIVALNCDDVSVCQRAIEALSLRHWREGAWDSFVMANIARRKLVERPNSVLPT